MHSQDSEGSSVQVAKYLAKIFVKDIYYKFRKKINQLFCLCDQKSKTGSVKFWSKSYILSQVTEIKYIELTAAITIAALVLSLDLRECDEVLFSNK